MLNFGIWMFVLKLKGSISLYFESESKIILKKEDIRIANVIDFILLVGF